MIPQSYATKHRQDVEAGRIASSLPKTRQQQPVNKNRLMLAKLESDKAELKTIRSKIKKQERKYYLALEYADYLTGVINSGDGSHNETLVTICLWSLDAGRYKNFVTLADYALIHNMNSPSGFKRTLPELLMEEFSKFVLSAEQPSDYRGGFELFQDMTKGADLTDEVTAKFYKAQGLAIEATDPQAALLAYQKAHQYGAKVKAVIKRLEKRLCKTENKTN